MYSIAPELRYNVPRMNNPKDLGKLLAQWRKHRGLNRPTMVAEMTKLGVTTTSDYLNKIERGERSLGNVSLEIREAIRTILRISVEDWEEQTGLYVPINVHNRIKPLEDMNLPSKKTRGPLPPSYRLNVYRSGTDSLAEENIYRIMPIPKDYIVEDIDPIGIYVNCPRMKGYIDEGGVAIIDISQPDCEPPCFCAVRIPGKGITIRYYAEKLNDGKMLLQMMNPLEGEREFTIAPEGTEVIGPVHWKLTHGQQRS